MRNHRSRAFTIIEILIAIVVLVLGITGIVALFPTAIESGNQTVEDTYSATITQSVVDAISVGLRESRYAYTTPAPGDRLWTYFVLNHDGVIDAPVPSPEDYANTDPNAQIWQKDYCILLPQSPAPQNNQSDQELTFLYPMPYIEGAPEPHLNIDQRQPANLAAGPGALRALSLLGTPEANPAFRQTTADGTPATWYVRTYQLGRYRQGDPNIPAPVPTNYTERLAAIRAEYRGEDIQSGTGPQQTIASDPYPTYSFAFTLKRARVDTGPPPPAVPVSDGRITAADSFSNSLYELKIYIFKNFNYQLSQTLNSTAPPPVPRSNQPVRKFITLISL